MAWPPATLSSASSVTSAASGGSGLLTSASSSVSSASSEACGAYLGPVVGQGRDHCGVGGVGRPNIVGFVEYGVVGGFGELSVCNGVADSCGQASAPDP